MPTLVILGAGVAGVPTAHHVLKHTVPQVPDLKVILVAPNSDMYLSLASVRGIVPGQFSDDKLFYPLAKNFSKYSSKNFELVLGKAEALNPDNSSVVVATNDGGNRTINYDSLVIATGSRTKEGLPWKHVGTTQDTKNLLHSYQDKIKAAKTIVVVGGGTTGLEVTGELGFEYSQNGTKEVVLIFNGNLPLDSRARNDVRASAVKELEKLKVRVISDTKVTNVKDAGPNGEKTLQLTKANGTTETLKADVYLPATGTEPNSSFAPASMRDSKGYINQDTFLKAPGYKNIFVLGDVGNLQSDLAMYADAQTIHLAKSLNAHFTGKQITEYKPDTKFMTAVTLGRSRAVAQVGTMKIFSIIIWYMKGRYMGTDKFGDIAAGSRTMTLTKW